MDADRLVVVEVGVAAPDVLDELAAAEHLAGVLGEEDEQAELGRREVERAAVAGDGGARAVDGEVAGVQDVRLGGGELAVGAAQQRADAGDELAQVVRLGEVVVGAHLEAEDLVHLVGLHGEHEDGLPQAELAQLAAEVEAVAVGQAHVEDDELRGVVAGEGDAAAAGGLPVHLVALGADALDEGLADGRVVLDHEDGLGAVSHGRNRSTGCGRPCRKRQGRPHASVRRVTA